MKIPPRAIIVLCHLYPGYGCPSWQPLKFGCKQRTPTLIHLSERGIQRAAWKMEGKSEVLRSGIQASLVILGTGTNGQAFLTGDESESVILIPMQLPPLKASVAGESIRLARIDS